MNNETIDKFIEYIIYFIREDSKVFDGMSDDEAKRELLILYESDTWEEFGNNIFGMFQFMDQMDEITNYLRGKTNDHCNGCTK